jgi:hypothetical protein
LQIKAKQINKQKQLLSGFVTFGEQNADKAMPSILRRTWLLLVQLLFLLIDGCARKYNAKYWNYHYLKEHHTISSRNQRLLFFSFFFR